MIVYEIACDGICGRPIMRSARSKTDALKGAARDGLRTTDGQHYCVSCAKAKGLLVPCPGEAHQNAFIDHCGVCGPRWGLVEPFVVATRKEK